VIRATVRERLPFSGKAGEFTIVGQPCETLVDGKRLDHRRLRWSGT